MILRELVEAERGTVAAFLLALDEHDRYWRFCRTMSDDAIRSYVEQLNFDETMVLGAFDNETNLIGLLELCDIGDSAEVGVAVAPEHRRMGIGRSLMERAVLKARVLGKERIAITCLMQNEPMRRLARSLNMSARAMIGDFTEGALALSAAGAINPSQDLAGSITYARALYTRHWENMLQKLLSTPWSMASFVGEQDTELDEEEQIENDAYRV